MHFLDCDSFSPFCHCMKPHNPNFSNLRLTKARKISRSSEDVRSGKTQTQTTPASVASGGLKNVANKFLGVVELDPTTGDLHVRSGGSLQKNLDKTGHVLEEGAVETAAIIEKGVLNPFTKLTKGLGAVLKGKYNLLFMIMLSKIFM